MKKKKGFTITKSIFSKDGAQTISNWIADIMDKVNIDNIISRNLKEENNFSLHFHNNNMYNSISIIYTNTESINIHGYVHIHNEFIYQTLELANL